jgi:uncharacterized protein YecA (UPF0149 family)
MNQVIWGKIRDEVADAVAGAIGLDEDLVVSEIRTSESFEEAIERLEAIASDVDAALQLIKKLKNRKGPKDWNPKGRGHEG